MPLNHSYIILDFVSKLFSVFSVIVTKYCRKKIKNDIFTKFEIAHGMVMKKYTLSDIPLFEFVFIHQAPQISNIL